MGGSENGAQYQFTGFKKYFNSYTMTGRVNCTLATYASIFGIFVLYKMLKPKKQLAVSDVKEN